jgi:hypothetical protein
VRVDGDDVRLVFGSDRAGAFTSRIEDLGPVPAVPTDERARVVEPARDADPEIPELRMLPLELCVGDRLALARASPSGPDIDEERSPAEVDERDALPVESDARQRQRWRFRPLASGRLREASALVAPGAAVKAVAPGAAVEKVVARAAAEEIVAAAPVHAVRSGERDDDVAPLGAA